MSEALAKYRSSFSLVRNNNYCKRGQTFRKGRHSYVEFGPSDTNSCDGVDKTGYAKPGPTTDTSSRIARIKKIQTRTRSNRENQAEASNGTKRGPHATVENSASGINSKSRRAQLFGDLGTIPQTTSGKCGDSSDVIYFKNIFERVSLNQPTTSGAN